MNCKQLILAATCVVLTTACSSEKQESQKEAIRVTTETVSRHADIQAGSYVGQVEEQQATSLSFTGSGQIKQLLVSEGQFVKRGQLVAVLDETQARNALATAEATLTQARDGYNRLKQVHDAGSLAEQKWVEMETNLQQAVATRDMARKALQDCRLVSPVSGVVGKVSLEAGETALPSVTVCSVLNIDQVKVKVPIPEHEISAIRTNTPSEITVAAVGDQTFRGRSIEKGVSADALTRTYDIKILVANPGHKLLPGMVANVKLSGAQKPQAGNALYVPVTAVHSSASGDRFVWKVSGGKATRAMVTTGEAAGNRIAITSGISEGEKIVVKGAQKLSEGSKVKE